MRLFQVDAFTSRLFHGNPAGVVLLDEPREASWMQSVAAEMNLAETAFLEAGPEPGSYGLRWFTPTVEVDLCGHATLASAHALWESGKATNRLRFATRSGELTAERTAEGIELDFPADAPTALTDRALADEVVAALRLEAAGDAASTAAAGDVVRWVGRNRDKFVVELRDEAAVRAVRPDVRRIAGFDAMGVIVTADADEIDRPDAPGRVDFVSRFFAPAVGIDEDPVTGAAHCALGPYWAERIGRTRLLGYQASARGGYVGVALEGPRALLTGQAVTVFHAEL